MMRKPHNTDYKFSNNVSGKKVSTLKPLLFIIMFSMIQTRLYWLQYLLQKAILTLYLKYLGHTAL